MVTRVGDDPFGDYVRQALTGFGVDVSRIGTHPTLRTPLAFCEIFPPDRFPLLFYREPKAPDLELELRRGGGGRGAAALDDRHRPARGAVALGDARGAPRARPPALTVHDLDFRATFWPPRGAGRWNREALGHATVAVGNAEEVAVALGEELEPADAAAALLDLGLELAVVKLGGAGVLGASRDGVVLVPALESRS